MFTCTMPVYTLLLKQILGTFGVFPVCKLFLPVFCQKTVGNDKNNTSVVD